MIFKKVATNERKIAVLDDSGTRIATLLKAYDLYWAVQSIYTYLNRYELKQICKKIKELDNANI